MVRSRWLPLLLLAMTSPACAPPAAPAKRAEATTSEAKPTGAAPTLESIRGRPLATWTQAEREFVFPRWTTFVRATRAVKHGERVYPLPDGAPIAALAPGGASAAQLDEYVTGHKVAGLLVLHDGKVRLERYALGHSAGALWPSFSVAKSMTSTLVGAAIKDGYIKGIDDPITQYIAALRGSAYDSVTIRQVLTMTSGVKWNEDYKDPNADVARFYSTPPDPGVDATVSYMRKLPREAPAGEKWVYKTGETNLLGVLVAEATHKPLAEYLSEKIWAAYGMEHDGAWQIDRSGHEQGGCCMQATLRDFARFGQFILDGARVDGRGIEPDDWLGAATRKQADTGRPGIGYGYQWWTRDDGTFYAVGIHGQLIHVDASRRLVVAISSVWPVATGADESAARAKALRLVTDAIDADARPNAGR